MGWFIKNYIYEEQVFDNKLLQIYREAFANKQKSDYDFTYIIDKDELKISLNEIKDFVNTVKMYLKKS